MQGPTRDEVEEIQTYTLGDTFTAEEKEYLRPRMIAFNSAVVRPLLECHALSTAKKIGVQPSTSGMGDGLFCGKQMNSGGNVGVYIGTLEVKTKYKGRGDYAISLPALEMQIKVDSLQSNIEKMQLDDKKKQDSWPRFRSH